jgi:hypothetical protein
VGFRDEVDACSGALECDGPGSLNSLRRIAQEIIATQQQEIAATRLALGQPFYVPITSRSTFHDARELPRECDAGLCRGLVREERLQDAPYS